MKKLFKISFISAMVLFFTGCETIELELLEDPNNLNVESADPNFVLNGIQNNFRSIMQGLNGPSMEIVRMIHMRESYNNSVDINTLNTAAGEYATSYRMFANIDLLEDIVSVSEDDLSNHLAIAQILEAYTYITLVDYLGRVPFSEANMPAEFPTPNLDEGADIYAAQLELLDIAISTLQSSGDALVPTDLFYSDFSSDNWIAVANTLKLKAYLNTGDAAGITSVASQNIIDTVEEDFDYDYGTIVNTDTDSRHPFFQTDYLQTANTYMSNQFYDFLNAGDAEAPFVETGIADPRLRYYIYRQRDEEPSGSNLPCLGQARYDYCYVGNKYWGRDHADDEGLPNDGARKSTYGLYPGGGAFDRETFERARDVSESLQGAGILPLYLSSYTHFALAEASLTLNTGGSAIDLLELGIRRSMTKVLNFGNVSTTNPDSGTNYAATTADVNDYVARVRAEFNAANNEGKLAVVAREWFLAAWGSGTEPYNTYRRTGLPDLQSPIGPAGAFPRVFRYSADALQNNPNIQQQDVTNQVFWDNNPAGFID
ncbi:MAG: SusD/RagB family nutrient-binding outer membrane lipoprotein [Patiriisocius sp.]|uniref:SusD/RagB family nutrient-binding outer membrane lipoprotein n=1 Tax=Patiriisocius sp. TaxID=2822396 RepID=UPI003EF104B5